LRIEVRIPKERESRKGRKKTDSRKRLPKGPYPKLLTFKGNDARKDFKKGKVEWLFELTPILLS
jgi:hypothetical protein